MRTFFTCYLLSIAYCISFAQVNTFQKKIHIKNYNQGISIIKDGTGYLVLFIAEDSTVAAQDYHPSLMRIDSLGNPTWIKHYKEVYGVGELTVLKTNNGLIMTAADDSAAYTFTTLIKVDFSGNLIWKKKYLSSGTTMYLMKTNDGGFLIAGFTGVIGAGNTDALLIKTDSSGNMQWLKTYGGSGYEIANHVVQTNDGGYAVAGYAQLGFGAGNRDFYMFKTDVQGNLQWSRTFGSSEWDDAYSIHQILTGEYIINGRTIGFNVGDVNYYVVKTDTNGNMLWSKTYGNTGSDNSYANPSLATSDGNILLHGITNSFGGADVLLIKIDTAGNVIRAMIYNAAPFIYFADMKEANDTGIIFMPIIGGYTDLYIIKTDPFGRSGCNERDVTDSIIVTDVPTFVTSPSTQVDSGGTQDTVSVSWDVPAYTEQTICFCPELAQAGFTYSINNTAVTFFNTSQYAALYQWSFGNGNTSVQQSPVYSYSTSGSYTVCLTASDSSGGCSTTICQTINIPLGVNEIESNLSMNIFPNPAHENFMIEADFTKAGEVTVSVLNLLGETMLQTTSRAGTGTFRKQVNVKQLAKGIYFVRINTQEGTAQRKIAVQ